MQIGDETSIKLLTLQEDISQSIELDKILLVSNFNALSTNDFFKLLKQLSGVLPIHTEVYLGNAKSSDDNELNSSMSFYHLFIRKNGLSLPLSQMMKIAIFILTNFRLALIILKNYC